MSEWVCPAGYQNIVNAIIKQVPADLLNAKKTTERSTRELRRLNKILDIYDPAYDEIPPQQIKSLESEVAKNINDIASNKQAVKQYQNILYEFEKKLSKVGSKGNVSAFRCDTHTGILEPLPKTFFNSPWFNRVIDQNGYDYQINNEEGKKAALTHGLTRYVILCDESDIAKIFSVENNMYYKNLKKNSLCEEVINWLESEDKNSGRRFRKEALMAEAEEKWKDNEFFTKRLFRKAWEGAELSAERRAAGARGY